MNWIGFRKKWGRTTLEKTIDAVTTPPQNVAVPWFGKPESISKFSSSIYLTPIDMEEGKWTVSASVQRRMSPSAWGIRFRRALIFPYEESLFPPVF